MLGGHTQSHGLPGDFLANVLQEWKRARASFSSALEDLFNATEAINLAYNPPFSALTVKRVVLAINEDQESFAYDERRLLDVRVTLSKYRNICAPVNRLLPPELLCHVFSLLSSTSESPTDSQDYCTIVASVCSSWRQLAIGTRPLWSHIDFRLKNEHGHLGNQLGRAGLHLERARGAPLHLNFNEQWEMTKDDREAAVLLVTPHITHLYSLNCFLHELDRTPRIIDCWLKYGTPGSLKRLSVKTLGQGPEMQLPGSSSFSHCSLNEFLQSVRSLSLSAVSVDWNCVAFSSLVELDLNNLQSSSLTTKLFARILAASPRLQSVKLCRVKIWRSNETQLVPIRLAHLQRLYLEDLTPISFEQLFSVLTPCSNMLDLHLITISNTSADLLDAVADLVCKYWGQVHVPVLRLEDDLPPHSALHKLLATFQSTHALALKNFDIFKPLLEALTGWTRDKTIKIPSTLRTAEFHRCYFESEEGLRDMIAACPIQKLTLLGCAIFRVGGWEDIFEAKELCVWLASVVPDLKVE
ncbi:hypothetical protein BDV93DRAFT_608416 [Ceratobasidium sp. AG-I]|nr:hypothetical protein BDV93DRAFT_608416 [Ceratobasidium sp. AG-I]